MSEKKQQVEIDVVLVRSVSALVATFADLFAPEGDRLAFEVRAYENLAVNCQRKAEMGAAFMAEEAAKYKASPEYKEHKE